MGGYDFLAILKDTYPEIPALRNNAREELRIHHEKKIEIKKKLEKQAWLVMVHICINHPNLLEPHRTRENHVKSYEKYAGIKGKTNAESVCCSYQSQSRPNGQSS